MAEITEQGYEFLREKVQESWRYVQVEDSDGNPLLRITPDDYRLTITHISGGANVRLELVLEGSDYDVIENMPMTIGYTSVYTEPTDGVAMAREEINPNIKISSTEDTVQIDQIIEIPRLSI